ncbi:hypothetical protein NPIL_455081 [Nephila pilipes]|uniref:Uncharacterized protein n=1 Tax=Nephila pilipes TaxID=299642 RepID=A0A8X6UI66_NEPPI|nr:hypothetical protein NPIL_455081 [Nephila pilipes]
MTSSIIFPLNVSHNSTLLRKILEINIRDKAKTRNISGFIRDKVAVNQVLRNLLLAWIEKALQVSNCSSFCKF